MWANYKKRYMCEGKHSVFHENTNQVKLWALLKLLTWSCKQLIISIETMFHKFANLAFQIFVKSSIVGNCTAYFKSKTVSRELPKGLNSLGFALCLQQPSSRISSAAFKCIPLRNSLIHRVSPNKQRKLRPGDEIIAKEDSCIWPWTL